MSRWPIRLRLAVASTAAMAAVLLACGWFLYASVSRELSSGLDQSLRQRAQDLAVLTRDGRRTWDFDTHGLIEPGETFAQAYAEHGSLLASSPSLGRRPLLTPAELARGQHRSAFLDRPSVPGLDEPARLLATPVASRDGALVLLVGATQGNRIETLATLRTQMLLFGPLALIAATAGGYLLAAAALHPVEAMRRRAEEITASTLSQRLPASDGGDELARLGVTLNGLLDRVEAAVDRERSFVADASHELRTPLALLSTELELGLRHPRSVSELRGAIASAAEQTQRLIALAEDLLLIAAVEQQGLPLRLDSLDTRDLLCRSLQPYEAELTRQGRAATADCDGVPVMTADAPRLTQALRNLVDNAVRHGAGTVKLSVRRKDGTVELHVTDEGPGFADDYLPCAFKRFSRPDAGRAGPGTGLGLSIARAVARAHGGAAGVASTEGRGADVWITVPDRRTTLECVTALREAGD